MLNLQQEKNHGMTPMGIHIIYEEAGMKLSNWYEWKCHCYIINIYPVT